jgi:hypothetical protein
LPREERKAFEACFESMQKGIAGAVDQLADHLAEACRAKKIAGRVDFAKPRASYSQERLTRDPITFFIIEHS